MSESPLLLGQIVGAGQMLAMSAEQRRQHTHVIGASGTGKSSLLESLMRQDIREGRGLCLIDPHGELARNVLAWASTLPCPIKRLLYIAPSRNDWTVSHNLLRPPPAGGEIDEWYVVNAMKLAAVKVWGAVDTTQTPRLDEWLTNAFYTGITLGLTLPDVGMLLEPIVERNPMREWAASRLPDDASRIRSAWQDLCVLAERKPTELEGRVGSTLRRLARFLDNPRLRRIYGLPDVALDLAQCMDERAVILVDLAPEGRLHPEDGDFFGTLMLADFSVRMFQRKERDIPFTLYIDEFQHFATGDLAEMLDESRKFGLRFVLAHQRPGQLRNSANLADRDIYSAVMTNARTKIVFGGIDPEELEPIARNISMGSLDPNKVRLEIRNPAVVGYAKEYWQAHSKTAGISRTTGTGGSSGSGSGSGSSTSGGASASFDPSSGLFAPSTLFTSESSAWQSHVATSRYSGESWMDATTQSQSEGVTTFPVLVPQMAEQLSAVYYESLADQLFQFMAVLYDQRQRHAIVRVADQHEPIAIVTPTVKPPEASEQAIARQIQMAFEAERCFVRVEDAGRILQERRERLELAASPAGVLAEPEGSGSDAAPHGTLEETTSSPNPMTESAVFLPKVGGTQLQPRDMALLADLFECRLITIRQAAALYFDGKEEAAKQRLLKLYGAGLLDKRALGVSAPDGSKTAYFFQKAALDLLMGQGHLGRYSSKEWDSKLRKRFAPSEITIKHELAVMNVKARLQPAVNATDGARVVHFGVWPLGYEFEFMRRGRKVTLQPDGYLCVADHRQRIEGVFHHFYLEVDRGTETLDTLAGKADGYREHYRTGGFRAWLRRPDSEPIDAHPFRVLVIAPSAARRDNICARLLEARIASQVWLTTQEEVEGSPLGAIWTFPKLFQKGGMAASRKVALLEDPSEALG